MSEKSIAVDAWESLFRAQVSVLRELNAAFPTDEVSFTEYDVLFNLSKQPERSSRIRDLNSQLLLTQPSVSRMIDRLVGRGLVEKVNDPADARGRIVRLTDAGFAVFRRVGVRHADAIVQRVGGALSAAELKELAGLCDKLRAGARR
ncbi:MarR family winged helix-turn-helix transcriptional regulator [Lysobacter korlensis]|uniref:MarR family winged helix-turn-helix transcriptional regulator n=1 Tax=Lysobacter korlensis TaxID=553636 RepID=A0ABV6RTW3_9GAMM